MKKILFFAVILSAMVMNLHAETANIDLTSGHTTSGQSSVTYNLDANISIVITCSKAKISNDGYWGTSFSPAGSITVKAADGCTITAVNLECVPLHCPGYSGCGFVPGSGTPGISNSSQYSSYSGSATQVVWTFNNMEDDCTLSKASVTYTKPAPDYHDFLHFVGLNGNDTVRLNKIAHNATYFGNLTATFEYSKDRITWTDYAWGTWTSTTKMAVGDAIALAKGDTVFFRAKGTDGKNATMSYSAKFYYQFVFGEDNSIAAGGNVMSLYDATCEQNTMTDNGFTELFLNAKQLVSAPKLPAEKLALNCYSFMFSGCTSLTQAPELKATTLANLCYQKMFGDCSSLTQAPALPATTLANMCYTDMFLGCTSLTQAPTLPANVLAENCYKNMFNGCTSLTQAPELKATTLANLCYQKMFGDCSSLTQAPALPATTLAESCYSSMFSNCSALTQAPALPATTLAKSCYSSMFQGCTSLTTAPELPANVLAVYCYSSMFKNCSSLTQAPALSVTTLAISCYNGMFSGCSSLEVDTCMNDAQCKGALLVVPNPASAPANWNSNMFKGCKGNAKYTAQNGIQLGGHYCIKAYVDTHDFLHFVSLKDGGTVKLNKSKATITADFQYSKDRIIWTDYTWPDNSGKGGAAITLTNAGDTVFFRAGGATGKNATVSNKSSYFTFAFGTNDSIAAGGNIMSLYDATCEQDTMTAYGFQSMFYRAKQLVSAPKLSTTKLADYCYVYMFRNCSALTQAPELPVETLTESCYASMFYGCSALTQAPALPATTLVPSCYASMFNGCSALTQAPALPATTLAKSCYNGMFSGCTALTQIPALPVTTLAPSCYSSMFANCTALTQAPELPADTLTESCYGGMFANCSALTQAPELKATKLTKSCYASMFNGCSALTQAPALPATTLAESCYQNMFQYCTALTQAPALPADTLTNMCYYCTFMDCTALTQAPELKATVLADFCYTQMFCGCTSLEVDTCMNDAQCEGALLVVPNPATAPNAWNNGMFDNCKGDAKYTEYNGIQLGGHYCMKAYKEPTGVESLTPALSSREGAMYNLQGMKVDANYKGIVIKNGKKYINRR